MPAVRRRSSMLSTKNVVCSWAWVVSACSSTCSRDSSHLFLSPSDDRAVLSALSCSFDFTFNPIHTKPSQSPNLNATETGRKQKEADLARSGLGQGGSHSFQHEKLRNTQTSQIPKPQKVFQLPRLLGGRR